MKIPVPAPTSTTKPTDGGRTQHLAGCGGIAAEPSQGRTRPGSHPNAFPHLLCRHPRTNTMHNIGELFPADERQTTVMQTKRHDPFKADLCACEAQKPRLPGGNRISRRQRRTPTAARKHPKGLAACRGLRRRRLTPNQQGVGARFVGISVHNYESNAIGVR